MCGKTLNYTTAKVTHIRGTYTLYLIKLSLSSNEELPRLIVALSFPNSYLRKLITGLLCRSHSTAIESVPTTGTRIITKMLFFVLLKSGYSKIMKLYIFKSVYTGV